MSPPTKTPEAAAAEVLRRFREAGLAIQPLNPLYHQAMIESWDAITYAEACAIVDREASWLRQRAAAGTLSRVGRTSDVRLSRLEVEALALAGWKAKRHQPGGYWCTVTEAAVILGCTHGFIDKLIKKDKLPALPTGSGKRVFRRSQVEVIANARRVRWHDEPVENVRLGYDPDEGLVLSLVEM